MSMNGVTSHVSWFNMGTEIKKIKGMSVFKFLKWRKTDSPIIGNEFT